MSAGYYSDHGTGHAVESLFSYVSYLFKQRWDLAVDVVDYSGFFGYVTMLKLRPTLQSLGE